MSQHKVRIDAVSPPPALPSRAAHGSHKGALLPLLRTGCQWADGEAPHCSWSSFCASAGDPLVLSLAQADLAAAQVPAGAAGPSCSRPQHSETGPGECSAAGTSSECVWWRLEARCEQICFPAVQLQLCGKLPCGVLSMLGNIISHLDCSSKWPKRSLCQHSLPPGSSQATSYHTTELLEEVSENVQEE